MKKPFGKRPVNPAEILYEAWGINETLKPWKVGVNKSTWCVGTHLWLSRLDQASDARRHRENLLYRRLHQEVADLHPPLQFPTIVLTKKGTDFFSINGGSWYVTQHLSGKQPDPKKLNLYPDIATGLGRLHLLLAKIPQNFHVVDSNLLSDIHCYLVALSKTEPGKALEKGKDI